MRHNPSTTLQRVKYKALQYLTTAPLEATGNPGTIRFDEKLCAQLHLPPRNVFRNLNTLKVPDVAYVAGAGPKLLEELKQIPPNAYVIACNRAIQAPFPCKAWMVFDLNCNRFKWFKKPPEGNYIKVFGHRLAKEHPDALLFSSRHTKIPHLITACGLQGGATIVGCALQLLFWAGCRTAIMLGAPLEGMTHFDGTQAQPRQGIWKQAHCMRYYIAQMQCGGMSVMALNENAMDVPLVSEIEDGKTQTPAP